MRTANDVNALLKARAEIDEQLRRHKNALTVLFTDVAGSTSFFERNGDTAGLVMLHRHDEVAARAIEQCKGKVVKTIGDSAMAEFPDPAAAVHAAVEIERQFHKLNLSLQEDQRVEVRIGIHTGVGFRKGNDLFGDVVNVAARIVKRTAPAQILISRAMHDEIADEPDLHCRWLSKLTIDGRTEKEDIFEVVWTDPEAYRSVQERLASSSHIPPRYEAISQIGMGGTGIVYKVRDMETGEIVALKILKPEIASDPDVQENFKRELCLARKITHKNVCRIHEFNRLNGTAYTSMELVEGESLLARLQRAGALPLSAAVEIGRQICAGLGEAHAQRIVHRDLKPANIMLDRSGTVKIMDFGVARMVHREGPMTGTIVGTPAYMSPEQAELKPVSASTDIYAVGLLLYEMITGVPAFSGDTPVAVALKQIREYPKRPREIMPELTRAIDAVIMKCLQKDPAKRFQSADALETALVKAAKARPISPWEAGLNRGVARAEMEIRDRLLPKSKAALAHAIAYLKSRDWSRFKRLQEDPVAVLGMAGMTGALAVFLVFGGWKTPTISAQTVPSGSQDSLPPGASAENGFNGRPTQYPLSPIASNEIDLYGDARANNGKAPAPTSGVKNTSLSSAPAPAFATPASPAASLKPARIVKQATPPVRNVARKPHSDAQRATPSQKASVPAQRETLAPAAVQNAAPEPAAEPTEIATALEPAFSPSYIASAPKAAADAAKTPKLYIEVGTFKDETWANNAVDKLTQLGFHAIVIHKNLLWTQSYHVQVGPYTDQKDIADARQSLAAQGFKAHPVN
jgi:serine/threonine protein kinase/class 3 adenylate cyclase